MRADRPRNELISLTWEQMMALVTGEDAPFSLSELYLAMYIAYSDLSKLLRQQQMEAIRIGKTIKEKEGPDKRRTEEGYRNASERAALTETACSRLKAQMGRSEFAAIHRAQFWLQAQFYPTISLD